MSVIHRPIPGYYNQINEPVNRYFSSINEEQLFSQVNWGKNNDKSLFQPNSFPGDGLNLKLTPENVVDEVYLRVEHQTLRKISITCAIPFTIHIHQKLIRTLGGERIQ